MAREAQLACIRNTPYIPGVEAGVIAEVTRLADGDVVSEAFIADWAGITPLTVVAYAAGTYPTFNTWGSIMFDATRSNFRCGTPLWWGALFAYITPVGSRVLTT